MTTNLNKVLNHIHHLLAPPGGDQTDGELLARFVAKRDEASFAALVRRHGPMVLAVCRRMLRHDQDAEDCFQATFMVLARKATTVKREAVSSWLYAVAYRTSLEARAVNTRRRTREKQVLDMPHPEVWPPEVQDWRPWLDQELNRLPEKYRAVIVACDLEGRSRKQAAHQLGITEGTLSSRLARGRRLLAKRLVPYGLSLSGATLAAVLCEAAASAQLSAALVSTTTKAAVLVAAGELTTVSAASAILMKGVLKSMFLTKLKLMVSAVMIVTVLGASGLVYRAAGQSASPLEKQSDGKPKSELERLRHENELLKLNLEVVLEKVHAQEAELRTLKAQSAHGVIHLGGDLLRVWDAKDGQPHKVIVTERQPLGAEVKPVQGAKEGQKLLNKDDLQRSIDSLEKAVKELREQLKKEALPQKGKVNEELRQKKSQLDQYEKQYKDLKDLTEGLKKSEADVVLWQERAVWAERMAQPGRQYITQVQAEADQARYLGALFDQAEAVLKVLRETRDAETQRKALDTLEETMKQLQGVHKKRTDSNKPR
ncbi:MAG TPA: sigma-70 family RNA polymerase sigma factor [Gemmataceae bacterium]|jgi:RNA polymerase sigma factor (sigma-70 family)